MSEEEEEEEEEVYCNCLDFCTLGLFKPVDQHKAV